MLNNSPVFSPRFFFFISSSVGNLTARTFKTEDSGTSGRVGYHNYLHLLSVKFGENIALAPLHYPLLGRPNAYCIKCLFQIVITQQCEQICPPHFGRVIPVLLLVSPQNLKAQS